MPITYHIDERLSRVTVEFRGTITDADLMTTLHELHSAPRHRLGMPELTDCPPAEITGEGLRRLAEATAALLHPSQQAWKVVLLVPPERPLIQGLSRMYRLLREPRARPHLFRSCRGARPAPGHVTHVTGRPTGNV